jgi:hypothetical protein
MDLISYTVRKCVQNEVRGPRRPLYSLAISYPAILEAILISFFYVPHSWDRISSSRICSFSYQKYNTTNSGLLFLAISIFNAVCEGAEGMKSTSFYWNVHIPTNMGYFKMCSIIYSSLYILIHYQWNLNPFQIIGSTV